MNPIGHTCVLLEIRPKAPVPNPRALRNNNTTPHRILFISPVLDSREVRRYAHSPACMVRYTTCRSDGIGITVVSPIGHLLISWMAGVCVFRRQHIVLLVLIATL